MALQTNFTIRGRNPDVLTCIANLSNDEVFTPPELAAQMLDVVESSWAASNQGEIIWTNPDVKFLDPFTKSGVFLRELTSRLNVGLAGIIPDLQERVDHILTKQIFGVATTALTAHIARRSLYCSKDATGEHSIVRGFSNPDGNIAYSRMEHSWAGGVPGLLGTDASGQIVQPMINGKCEKCGARQSLYDKGTEFENHAYAPLHAAEFKEFLNEAFGDKMQFDVIIGNPPYQLSDGGGEGAGAVPLYHLFVNQAKALAPRQIIMVTPARWYSGGKGLNDYREEMLSEGKIAEIHDYPETNMVFPGVNIRGGVSYFVWKDNHTGPTRVVNYRSDNTRDEALRPLLEDGTKVFIRHNRAVSILKKVLSHDELKLDEKVQSRNPYDIDANFSDFSTVRDSEHKTMLFRSRRGSIADREVFIADRHIKSNIEFRDRLKVLVSKASPGGDEYPHAVFSKPLLGPIGSVSTETYLIVDFVANEEEASNLMRYMQTKFFRFLVALIKNTQNISKGSFAFVPVQDLSIHWTDEMLNEKYGITDAEAQFIDTMIRPIDGDWGVTQL